MSPEQIELARHALGLSRSKCSFRNRFVAGPGHPDHDNWMAMVADGDAKRRDGSTLPFSGDDMFWLTRSGAEKTLKRGETLDAEDFPVPA